MFRVSEIENLLGAGRHGGDPDAIVSTVTADSRQARPGALFVALEGRQADGAAFAADASARGAAAVLCRSGADVGLLAERTAVLRVADPLGACGRLAARHRDALRGVVIAITGSTGKTTTKELLHWLLSWSRRGVAAQASFNNSLGVPLTVLSATRDDEYLVTEVGTNAPGEIDALASIVRPDVAIVTCVGASHLAGLSSIDEVAREKARLFQHLRPGGVAIKNASDARVAAMAVPAFATEVRIALADSSGNAPPADIVGRIERVGMDGLQISIAGVAGVERVQAPLLGRHNAINILAAIAAARAAHPTCLIPESWRSFQGPPMRMQIIEREHVTFLNDAYNANPLSMGAALSTLAEMPSLRRIAVLGEMGELGSDSEQHHLDIGRHAARLPLEALLVVGARARGIAAGARDGGFDPARILFSEGLTEARKALGELVQDGTGQLVLLKASRSVGLERLLN